MNLAGASHCFDACSLIGSDGDNGHGVRPEKPDEIAKRTGDSPRRSRPVAERLCPKPRALTSDEARRGHRDSGRMLNVTTERFGNVLAVHVEGRIDSANFGRFLDVMKSGVEESDRAVIVNMERLVYIGSEGLRAHLVTARFLQQRDARLVFCCVADHIRGVFRADRDGQGRDVFRDQERRFCFLEPAAASLPPDCSARAGFAPKRCGKPADRFRPIGSRRASGILRRPRSGHAIACARHSR